MNEETQAQPAPTNSNEGNNTQAVDRITQLDNKIKRLEETEKRVDSKISQYEQLIANEMLSGRTTVIQNNTPKVETAKEYSDRVMNNKIR